jgi:hypothetical protein
MRLPTLGGAHEADARPRPPLLQAPASGAHPRPVMPFPDLAAMIAESQGVQRPARRPIGKLPAWSDPNTVSSELLGRVMGYMGNHANWSEVSYRASNHREPMDKVRAEWAKRDAREDVNEAMAQMAPRQQEICRAAFAGGMAEIPSDAFPKVISLEWIHAHHPPRESQRR